MRIILVLGLFLAAAGNKVASAQVVYNNAATAGESYARGMADVVRSAGAANLQNSEAANNYEEARSKNLDNRLKYTQTYFDNRQLNKQYRDAEKSPPVTSEQLYRWAHEGVPKPLNSKDLDPLTGDIHWPIVLKDKAYDPYRQKAERFFKTRATSPGEFTYDQYVQVQQGGEQWLDALKSRIRDYNGTDYVKAKKFIQSLSYEALKS